MSFERSILRAGQAVKFVRPENKFWVPCEHSLTLSLTMQRYESFIAVLECFHVSFRVAVMTVKAAVKRGP